MKLRLSLLAVLCASNLALAGEPAPPDAAPKEKKPDGPEHNVTLSEEPRVLDLLNRAAKARARAEKDAEVWPECIKYYSDILKNYANSVYLDKWEGPDGNEPGYKNGLYKSTRERVARDIASLPPEGLAVYRLINDPPARALYNDAHLQFDERKMEQVAQDYFPTSFGAESLAWMAEYAYDHGIPRQTLARLNRMEQHPNPAVPVTGRLLKKLLVQIKLADRPAAENVLKDLEAALKDPKNGELRAGHSEGAQALEALKARVAAIGKAGTGEVPGTVERSLSTFYGNAAHNFVAPERRNIGLFEWSVPIRRLLYGPSAEIGPEVIQTDDNQLHEITTLNHQITAQGSYFYLCNSQVIAAYPTSDPRPGSASAGGNAKFFFPQDVAPPVQPKDQANANGQRIARVRGVRIMQQSSGANAMRQHPYFCTLANGRLYGVLGSDAGALDPNLNMFGGQQLKQQPNYLVALGRQGHSGRLESGKLVWSLQPEVESAFALQSKADQEWLKTVFFSTAPTYDSGLLYSMAVQMAGTYEAWAVAVDADTGKLVWRTQICAANPLYFLGPVQPDVALPLTVANGTAYCVTNLGAVAALEALSGQVKWIRIYDRITPAQNQMAGGWAQGTFWGPNPPIVYNNLLICTPQDSEMMYGYDIESGKLKWWKSRNEHNAELKHILGITHGALVVTGRELVHFFDVLGLKVRGEPIPLDGRVWGRGAVAENSVFVPTEKSLYLVDVSGEKENLRTRIRDRYEWKNSKTEAGNVFLAGDVLFTVSASHVNAYFVWEEMEKRLKERIAAHPEDIAAYVELAGDVYYRIERFDQALAELEKALTIAAQHKDDARIQAVLGNVYNRKFDVLYTMGGRDPVKAAGFYQKAYEAALGPGTAPESAVRALYALAQTAESRNDLAAQVTYYQQMIARHGSVVYAFEKDASSQARIFAQGRIQALKKIDPLSYERVETAAKAALQDAGSDPKKLEDLLRQYPNSDAGGSALLKLAELESDPDRARGYAQRYLSRYRSTGDTALPNAFLAVTYERSGMIAPARQVLQHMAERAEFEGKTLPFDPADPQHKPAAPIPAQEWAKKRLAQAQFQNWPSNAVLSLGNGILKESAAGPAKEQSLPLFVDGVPPVAMRRNIFFLENQASELAVVDGESLEEIWTPRLKVPAFCAPRGVWSDNLLVLYGGKEIVAFDTHEKGGIAWRCSVPGGTAAPPAYTVKTSEQRLIVAFATGAVSVLDSSSGSELWNKRVGSSQIFGEIWKGDGIACGSGFVAVASTAPPQVSIYDVETGAPRDIKSIVTGLNCSPVAVADRLYYADGTSIYSVDGNTGKIQWQKDAGGPVTLMSASGDIVVCAVSQRKIIAFSTKDKGDQVLWSPLLPDRGTIREMLIDGDDLYVTVNMLKDTSNPSQIVKYIISSQGKRDWVIDIASDPVNTIPLSASYVTARQIVVTQSIVDTTGAKPNYVSVVDRRTGKLVWSQPIHTDIRPQLDGSVAPTIAIQPFDGGLVVTEARKRVSYVAEHEIKENPPAATTTQITGNPADPLLKLRAFQAQFEKGEREQALAGISGLLASGKYSDEEFAKIYSAFSRLRKSNTGKPQITLQRIEKAPKLNGDPAEWAGVPEKVLDQWTTMYLASEDQEEGVAKNLWRGTEDLKVSFRAAYDDKTLHLLFIVHDDKHKNEAEGGIECDHGDSVKVMFDSDNSGGVAMRGEAFMLGSAVTTAGQMLGWRWCEHGRILGGDTPLQAGTFLAARNEVKKETVYQYALPLEYLKIKAQAGTKFGFTFIVNDRDDGDFVEKGMALSPGALNPPLPDLFGEAVLK